MAQDTSAPADNRTPRGADLQSPSITETISESVPGTDTEGVTGQGWDGTGGGIRDTTTVHPIQEYIDETTGNQAANGATWNPTAGEEPTLGDYAGYNLDTIAGYYNANPLDTAGYDAYKGYALRDPSQQANSVWGEMMRGRQGLEETNQRARAASEAAGALATSRSNLAQRGGLSGAAAERMGGSGMRDQMMRQQEIARQGALSRFDIDLADEKNRVEAMSGLQGMANDIRSSHQLDATALADAYMRDADNSTEWDLTRYGEDSKRWAAAMMADAMARADR